MEALNLNVASRACHPESAFLMAMPIVQPEDSRRILWSQSGGRGPLYRQ